MSAPRFDWVIRAVWGDRREGFEAASLRLQDFFGLLAQLSVGLDAWFVRGRYLGREALWDARGDSAVVESELRRNADDSDFGQGLPVMTCSTATVVDGGSSRDAACRLVVVWNPPPISVWFPNSVEVSFQATPDDALLTTTTSVNVMSTLASTLAPWWAIYDLARPPRNDVDEQMQGRPAVGRVTYLADAYGAVSGVSACHTYRTSGGTIIALDAERLRADEVQEAAVGVAREELASAGHLLRRDEVEARLAAGLRSSIRPELG